MAKHRLGTGEPKSTQVGSNGFVNRRSTVQSRPPAHGSDNHVITEEWRPIPGLDGWYEASSLGRIRETAKHSRSGKARLVRPTGPIVALRVLGQRRRLEVHRLVAAAFLGEYVGSRIEHIDGDTRNCAAANLRLVVHRPFSEITGPGPPRPGLVGRARREKADRLRTEAASLAKLRRTNWSAIVREAAGLLRAS